MFVAYGAHHSQTLHASTIVATHMPCDRFCFEGFLPQKKGRQTRLTELAGERRTMVFYESPFRLAKTLAQFAEFFGDGRKAAVCREISKVHETTHRGTLGELRDYFTANEPKGEIVIVVQGADDRPKKDS